MKLLNIYGNGEDGFRWVPRANVESLYKFLEWMNEWNTKCLRAHWSVLRVKQFRFSVEGHTFLSSKRCLTQSRRASLMLSMDSRAAPVIDRMTSRRRFSFASHWQERKWSATQDPLRQCFQNFSGSGPTCIYRGRVETHRTKLNIVEICFKNRLGNMLIYRHL